MTESSTFPALVPGRRTTQEIPLKTPLIRTSAALILLAGVLAILATPDAEACTRAVYFGKEGHTVTGRSMDWVEDMHSNMWIFPRDMHRSGGLAHGSLEWVSKHGSVITSVYEGGTADGINEKGLVANLLYLAESDYPPADDKRPAVVITAWAQYVLDNFATVNEAVDALQKDTFRVVPTDAPNGARGTVHLSISDTSADSAIFEYVNGKLVIHHGKNFQVMTNSPIYNQQLALNEYWKEIGGTVMLPGTNRAADRFARASFYINACEQSADPREAVASVFSVMSNVSVPRGIRTKSEPNIASTLWRTVADHKERIYFFENTASTSLVWVKLDKLDFAPGTGTRKLTLDGKPELGGDQSANFEKAEPFKFLAPK
jgi:penicillin V acylase-like amidase (Ntn superfamily)